MLTPAEALSRTVFGTLRQSQCCPWDGIADFGETILPSSSRNSIADEDITEKSALVDTDHLLLSHSLGLSGRDRDISPQGCGCTAKHSDFTRFLQTRARSSALGVTGTWNQGSGFGWVELLTFLTELFF